MWREYLAEYNRHMIARSILCVVSIFVALSAATAQPNESTHGFQKSARTYGNHFRPQYQAEYVRGLLDGFRFVGETGINLSGLDRCAQAEEFSIKEPLSFIEMLVENPATFDKVLMGMDFKARPAVEVSAIAYMFFCENHIEMTLDVIKSRQPKRYLLSGDQLVNAVRPQFEHENKAGILDAFLFLSRTEERYFDIIQCHEKYKITWFDVTGIFAKFVKRPWMFGSFPGDNKVADGPAVEAFVLMNRRWCAELDEHAEKRRSKKIKAK